MYDVADLRTFLLMSILPVYRGWGRRVALVIRWATIGLRTSPFRNTSIDLKQKYRPVPNETPDPYQRRLSDFPSYISWIHVRGWVYKLIFRGPFQTTYEGIRARASQLDLFTSAVVNAHAFFNFPCFIPCAFQANYKNMYPHSSNVFAMTFSPTESKVYLSPVVLQDNLTRLDLMCHSIVRNR